MAPKKPKFTKHADHPIYGLEKVDERADVFIGGPGKKFHPHVRSEKWNNPHPRFPGCWLEMTAKDVEESQSNKRKIQNGKRHGRDCELLTSEFGRKNQSGKFTSEHHEWYLGNSLDWDVIFTSKAELPEERNEDGDYILRFALNYPESVTPYHQPELTQAEIDDGHFRPDHVINSYAFIFNRSGKFTSSDGTELVNYETGKYGHLYRAKIILPDLSEHWCKQSIIAGELVVAIPKEVVNAWNPSDGNLILDPTFGYTSIGGTTNTTLNNLANVGSTLTYTPSSGTSTITAYTTYTRKTSGSATGTAYFAAYDVDGSNIPQNRLASAVSTTAVPFTAAWISVTGLSQTLTNGNKYCAAKVSRASSNSVLNYYDTGSSQSAFGGSPNILPDPWQGTGLGAAIYSLYATYTVATGRVPYEYYNTYIGGMS